MTSSPPIPSSGASDNHDVSEATGLLESSRHQDVNHDKPFPSLQILLLCYARLMEGIAFFSIFPYVPQMIQHCGNLPDSQVGFYTGLVESSAALTEVIALPFWNYLADRMGRKHALLCSLTLMMTGPVLFGFSTSISQMILTRCLAGFFAGSGLIIRTMIGEQTTPKTQAVAYGWFSLTDSLGAFIGPLVGGALADPATQYPGVFGGIQFFETYRFVLPGIAVSVIDGSGIITSLLLKETMQTTERSSVGSGQLSLGSRVFQLHKTPGILVTLSVFTQTWLVSSLYVSVLPVALFTPIKLGGIGLSTAQISIYMGIQAVSQAIWLLIAFPIIQHRLGAKGTIGICAIGYPFFFLSYIIMNSLLREGGQISLVFFWFVTALTAIVGPAVFMSYGAAQLVINEASPDSSMLGSLNTVALMMMNSARIVAPEVATSLYAVGVKNQILGGYLGWLVFIAAALVLYSSHKWLPDKSNIQN